MCHDKLPFQKRVYDIPTGCNILDAFRGNMAVFTTSIQFKCSGLNRHRIALDPISDMGVWAGAYYSCL